MDFHQYILPSPVPRRIREYENRRLRGRFLFMQTWRGPAAQLVPKAAQLVKSLVIKCWLCYVWLNKRLPQEQPKGGF